jgi:DNA topoisomerase-3
MKTLIIAEKPSVAKDIAAALGGFVRQGDWLERDDAIVTSAIGHLVELACPEADDPGYDLKRLPAMPAQFNLAPIPRTAEQLKIIQKLLGRPDVTSVINACDAGREGELIFRYIYHFCGCRKAINRMWLQSMTHTAIQRAFAAKRPGKEFDGLFAAAQCRSEADWLVGINATRAVSILNSMRTGNRSRHSVGRVQTPTLAMIVQREDAIRNFVAKPYLEIHAVLGVNAGEYPAKWINQTFQPNEQNPEAKPDRLFDKKQADAIVAKCSGMPVISVSDRSTEVAAIAPKLFDLTTLQREANRKYGLSASGTLACAQALYEKHKALTYPRTDANCLPEDYLDSARATLQRLGQRSITIAAFATQAAGLVKPDKRIFNDAKISDHFAIIPTGQTGMSLTSDEAKIFDLVSRRFVAAFFPPAKYLQTVRSTNIAHELFRSSGRVLVDPGWLAVYGQDADDTDEPALCAIAANEVPRNLSVKAVALKTKPPARYTEAMLLAAMESAGADIEEEDLRDAMKERGLGTPATRAAIIDKLLDDKAGAYIERVKKALAPTQKGCDLIDFLRANDLMPLASVNTTGEWEFKLREMEKGRVSQQAFMREIQQVARDVVERVRANAAGLPATAHQRVSISAACPNCGGIVSADARTFTCEKCEFKLWRVIAGRALTDNEGSALIANGSLSALTGFTSSKGRPFAAGLKLTDKFGKVEFVFEQRTSDVQQQNNAKPDDACPTCHKGKLVGRRNPQGKAFLGCAKFPACRHFQWLPVTGQ